MMPKRLPPLPRYVSGPKGRVRVVLRDHPRDHDDEGHDPLSEPCWGTYSGTWRRVEILRTATLEQQWFVLFHELAHMALMDAGNLLDGSPHEEAVCDAFAAAQMRERFSRTVRLENKT